MFNPADFITLAQELSSGNEAKVRTSICRTYFYAFLSTREWLKAKGVVFQDTGKDHQIAQDQLKKYVNRATKDLLGDLRRNYRNKADYKLEKMIYPKEAEEAIVIAKKIVGNLNSGNIQ